MKCFLVLVVIATTSVTSRYVHKSRHQLRSTAANTDTLSPSETSTSTPQTHSTQTEADGTTSFQPPSDPSKLQEAAAKSADGNGPNSELALENKRAICHIGPKSNCRIVRKSCECMYEKPSRSCCNEMNCNRMYGDTSGKDDLCKTFH